MTEVERMSRLLCKVAGHDPDGKKTDIFPGNWHDYWPQAKALAAAGLTIVRVEPDEARCEERATPRSP